MFSGTTERLLGPNCSHSHTHELETGGKKNAKFAVVLSAADAEESQVSHSWQWCPGAQSEKEKVSRKAKMFFKDVQHHPCWTQMWTSVKRSKIVQNTCPYDQKAASDVLLSLFDVFSFLFKCSWIPFQCSKV